MAMHFEEYCQHSKTLGVQHDSLGEVVESHYVQLEVDSPHHFPAVRLSVEQDSDHVPDIREVLRDLLEVGMVMAAEVSHGLAVEWMAE